MSQGVDVLERLKSAAEIPAVCVFIGRTAVAFWRFSTAQTTSILPWPCLSGVCVFFPLCSLRKRKKGEDDKTWEMNLRT